MVSSFQWKEDRVEAAAAIVVRAVNGGGGGGGTGGGLGPVTAVEAAVRALMPSHDTEAFNAALLLLLPNGCAEGAVRSSRRVGSSPVK